MKANSKNDEITHVMAASVVTRDSHYDKFTISSGSSSVLEPSSELTANLLGDVIVACGVTFGLSPFMSVIDKSIVQRAAGTHTVLQSCTQSVKTMVRNPISFVKSPMFLMMWGVYAATYSTGKTFSTIEITLSPEICHIIIAHDQSYRLCIYLFFHVANCLKTIVKHQEETKMTRKESKSASKFGPFGVFALTTAVNSTATMIKDSFYARNFGTATSVTKIPLFTYGLWGLRDCIVIGSAFVLPDIVSVTLQEKANLDEKTALKISQLSCPVIAQFIAGPTQLLGLDLYNRPLANLSYSAAVMERIRFQYNNYASIVGVRIARIAPAYGIGGVCNTYFRDCWRMKIKECQTDC